MQILRKFTDLAGDALPAPEELSTGPIPKVSEADERR